MNASGPTGHGEDKNSIPEYGQNNPLEIPTDALRNETTTFGRLRPTLTVLNLALAFANLAFSLHSLPHWKSGSGITYFTALLIVVVLSLVVVTDRRPLAKKSIPSLKTAIFGLSWVTGVQLITDPHVDLAMWQIGNLAVISSSWWWTQRP